MDELVSVCTFFEAELFRRKLEILIMLCNNVKLHFIDVL